MPLVRGEEKPGGVAPPQGSVPGVRFPGYDAGDVQLVIRGELLEGKDSGLPIIKLQSASKRATNTFS